VKFVSHGLPRSGTRTLCDTLRSAGLQVEHERWGKDGAVNPPHWRSLPDGEEYRDENHDVIVFHMRHPLRVMGSLHNIIHIRWIHSFYHYGRVPQKKDVFNPENLGRIYWGYLRFILHKHRFDMVLRLETLAEQWDELRSYLPELDPTPVIPWTHRSDAKPVTWESLGEFEKPIRDFAHTHGYGDELT
jgi:hypothetical protein